MTDTAEPAPEATYTEAERYAAYRDPRHPAVLAEVAGYTWPGGQPMVGGGWSEHMTTNIVAALIRVEHTPEYQTASFRICLIPTCLRQMDMIATMGGEPLAHPQWSGKGWHMVRHSAVHAGGGYVCPDHRELIEAHFPNRTTDPEPGRIDVHCACGQWANKSLRWHGAARGLWEEHLLEVMEVFQ